MNPKYGECMHIVLVGVRECVSRFLCDCVMQHHWDFGGPVPLKHLMKVHDPSVKCQSYPIPESPGVPWRSLSVSDKGTYSIVNGKVNMTDMSLSLFSFFIKFLCYIYNYII